jgi:hypothetical protein
MPQRWGKDVERLARAFVRQKLDPAYVRHYLMEHFQLDAAAIDDLLLKIGAVKPPPIDRPGPVKKADDKVKKQGFF